MHPPRLDLHLGHRRSLAAVGTVPLPRTLVPMKATSGDLPVGEGWTYEVKWDGMRALCFVDGDQLRVQSYNERDVTVSWPELAGLPDALPADHRAARRRAGRHRRRRPAELRAAPAAHARHRRRPRWRPRPAEVPVAYVVFDLLHLDGHDLCGLPLADRRRLLDQVLEPGPRWRVLAAPRRRRRPPRGREGARPRGRRRQAPRLPLRAGQAHPHVAEGEGAAPPGDGGRRLAARRGQPHRPHRRAARRLPRRGRRRRSAALRGTGRHGLQGRRAARASAGCSRSWPPTSAPSTRRRPAPRSCAGPRWVRPELVAELEFGEWTHDDRLRHPSYLGLRDDKPAAEVTRDA